MDKPHNAILNQAQRIKNDEFYTQYADIQNEMNAYLDFDSDVFRDKTVLLPCDDPEWSNFTKFFAQNFELFGLKKLISTSYAVESKQYKKGYQPSLFETRSPSFDSDRTRKNGKIFMLTRALDWVGRGNIDGYMSAHRTNPDITELKTYFNSVIDWVSTVFTDVKKEMRGLEWGRLYELYHAKPYNPKKVSEQVERFCADPYVTSKKGVFEYILGGYTEPRLLNIRVFDEATKRTVYTRQTELAKRDGVSNCPLCAAGNNANKTKIWKLSEMDADHVTAWSNGGATDISNCEMLCVTHNRAKGNGNARQIPSGSINRAKKNR